MCGLNPFQLLEEMKEETIRENKGGRDKIYFTKECIVGVL